jgi:hypothetical protein
MSGASIRVFAPLVVLAGSTLLPLAALGQTPAIRGYEKASVCLGEKVKVTGSHLGAALPPKGNVRMGTGSSSGQILAPGASTRWPEVTIPKTLAPGRWWIGLWKGGKELTRGPTTLQLRECVQAQTARALPLGHPSQKPMAALGKSTEVEARAAPQKAPSALPKATSIEAIAAGPGVMTEMQKPELEIVSVRPASPVAPTLGDVYELKIEVRNNGNGTGEFGLAYTQGNEVRLGGRHSLAPKANGRFSQFVEINDQVLQRGGTRLATRFLLTNPKASTRSSRVEDHLFQDSNNANHVKSFDVLLGHALLDVTMQLVRTRVAHDCDDIDDGLGWEIKLAGFAVGGPSATATLKIQGVAGERIEAGPTVVLRGVRKDMDLQANIDVTDFDLVGADKVGGYSVGRAAGNWNETSIQATAFDLGGAPRDDCGRSMATQLEMTASPSGP